MSKIASSAKEAFDSFSLGLIFESNDKPEGKLAGFVWLLKNHLRKQVVAYVLLGLCASFIHSNYTVSLNMSGSLPHSFYVVRIGQMPQKGEIASFYSTGGLDFKPGDVFMKRVAGVKGSVVERDGKKILVDGNYVGDLVDKSSKGVLLTPSIEDGKKVIVPFGHYYMAGDHEGSFDSRYELVGMIPFERIKGTVVYAY